MSNLFFSEVSSKRIKDKLDTAKISYAESVWCWKAIDSRPDLSSMIFGFFMEQTDCISVSKANELQTEKMRKREKDTISSPWNLLHNSSWVSSLFTFFFTGVLAC